MISKGFLKEATIFLTDFNYNISKIKNKRPSPILLASWVAGWSVGWLAGWLAAKGFLKESYTNPYEIRPASQPATQPTIRPGGCGGVVDF